MQTPDFRYMRLAMILALKAKGQTSPNPLVGAILVKKGRIISTGYHRYCGADHAEVMAIKNGGSQVRGATLYVTLEPCCHYGRTPPCVDTIIQSGIKEVVVGMKDPNPLMSGRSLKILKKAGIKIRVGLLQDDLLRMNEIFVKYIRTRMPFVVAKMAQTIDGKVANLQGQSQWITSEKTRGFSHRLRNDFDAILVGVNTVLKDNPYLNAMSKTKRIKKIVLDSGLRTPLDSNLFKKTSPEDVFIATTTKADKNKLKILQKKGINVIICPKTSQGIRLQWLLNRLASLEICSILIEGGASVIGSAFQEKLVDKVWIFMAPKIMGDAKALSSVVGLKNSKINRLLTLKNVCCHKINDDIFIEGYLNA